MRYSLLVLAIALTAGATHARADQIVTYLMTGTIRSSYNMGRSINGDYISWMLQYNASTPGSGSGTSAGNYSTFGAVISDLTDQSKGGSPFAFWTHDTNTSLSLHNASPDNPQSFFDASQSNTTLPGDPAGHYSYDLHLNVNGSLPTLNLANLQLSNLPLNLSTSFLNYRAVGMAPPGENLFAASVTSISGPFYATPEPGSLTLFLLGVAGLAARGLRRRLRIPARFLPCHCRRWLTH